MDYCDILSKIGFFNVIESPTRPGTTKHSLIDRILVNNARWHYKSGTIDFDISDHLPVCASLALNKTSESGIESSQMFKINYSKLRDNLQYTDWDEVLMFLRLLKNSLKIYKNKLKFLVTPKMSKEINAKLPHSNSRG